MRLLFTSQWCRQQWRQDLFPVLYHLLSLLLSAQNSYIPDDNLLPIDPTDLHAIDTYLEQRHQNSGHLLSPPPITPPNPPVDEELADLSLHISSLRLNEESLTAAMESNNALRAQVHIKSASCK